MAIARMLTTRREEAASTGTGHRREMKQGRAMWRQYFGNTAGVCDSCHLESLPYQFLAKAVIPDIIGKRRAHGHISIIMRVGIAARGDAIIMPHVK